MEILIIGVIVVIVMVIVSTRIKKNAAKAFEPEEIVADDFSIRKPEGFLYPLRDKPDFPFEAYSKLFGERSTRNIWRCRARLRIHSGQTAEELISEYSEGETVTSRENARNDAGRNTVFLRSTREDDDVRYSVARKLVESGDRGKIYELRITTLEPYIDEYEGRVEEMLSSFTV